MKYMLLILSLIALIVAPAFGGVPDDLQRVSVTIKAGRTQGSGTLVTRQVGDDTMTFIWTAAHVVADLRTARTVVTPASRRAGIPTAIRPMALMSLPSSRR